MTTSNNVGSKKLFENDSIILWEFTLEPGEASEVHSHELDYVFYVLEGSPLQVITDKGEDLGAVMLPTDEVFAQKVEGDNLVAINGDRPPLPRAHKAVNAGPSRYREILVEWKK